MILDTIYIVLIFDARQLKSDVKARFYDSRNERKARIHSVQNAQKNSEKFVQDFVTNLLTNHV